MKKKQIKVIIIIVSAIFFYAIFSDWEHFKDGLFGRPPIAKIVK